MITLNKNEFVENVERALSLIEEKDYQVAIQFLNNAIETYDQFSHEENDLDLAYLMNLAGNISMLDGNFDVAKIYFEKALNQDPASSLACSGLGDILFISGNYEAAKTMYEWGVKNDQGNQAAIEGLSKVNKLYNYPQDANSLIESIKDKKEIENRPDESKPETQKLIEDAYELFNRKNFDNALNKLTNAEKLFNGQLSNPTDTKFASSFYNMKGFIYLGLDDIDKAKSCFEKALNLEPNSSQACAGLGEVLFLTEQDQQAKIMFEWAVKNNPDNLFAIGGLKKINKILGLAENDSSLDENKRYKETSELKSDLNEILTASFELFGKKNFLEAITKLDNAKGLFYSQNEKNFISAFENLKGLNYLGLDEKEKARERFEAALNVNPESSQALAGLGELFYLNNNDTDAKIMFEKALNNNPVNLFAAGGLSKVNRILGLPYDHSDLEDNVSNVDSFKFKAALNQILESSFELFGLKYFDEAIENLNKSEELFYSQKNIELISAFENLKGFNYLGLDNKEAARECFETALNINPKSSQACAGLAELFYLEGKDKEAKTMYEYALENNPDNQFALGGLEKVNKLLNLSETNNTMAVNK